MRQETEKHSTREYTDTHRTRKYSSKKFIIIEEQWEKSQWERDRERGGGGGDRIIILSGSFVVIFCVVAYIIDISYRGKRSHGI